MVCRVPMGDEGCRKRAILTHWNALLDKLMILCAGDAQQPGPGGRADLQYPACRVFEARALGRGMNHRGLGLLSRHEVVIYHACGAHLVEKHGFDTNPLAVGQAVSLVFRMPALGITPDEGSFGIAMRACNNSQQYNESLRLSQLMKDTVGAPKNAKTRSEGVPHEGVQDDCCHSNRCRGLQVAVNLSLSFHSYTVNEALRGVGAATVRRQLDGPKFPVDDSTVAAATRALEQLTPAALLTQPASDMHPAAPQQSTRASSESPMDHTDGQVDPVDVSERTMDALASERVWCAAVTASGWWGSGCSNCMVSGCSAVMQWTCSAPWSRQASQRRMPWPKP